MFGPEGLEGGELQANRGRLSPEEIDLLGVPGAIEELEDQAEINPDETVH
jgi:hypothetical protein